MELRQMHGNWWNCITKVILASADMGDQASLFQYLKTVFGPFGAASAPLLSSDDLMLTTDHYCSPALEEVLLQPFEKKLNQSI